MEGADLEVDAAAGVVVVEGGVVDDGFSCCLVEVPAAAWVLLTSVRDPDLPDNLLVNVSRGDVRPVAVFSTGGVVVSALLLVKRAVSESVGFFSFISAEGTVFVEG